MAAASVAAWSVAAPPRRSSHAAKPTKLPPLPTEVKQRKLWNIGVKCDSPPFGYINVQGKNSGFDVEIARWFSRYAFGKANRVRSPARRPQPVSRRSPPTVSTW